MTQLVAHLLYERVTTAARVEAALSAQGIELATALHEPDRVAEVGDNVDILVVEVLSHGEALVAQVRSLASLVPEAVVIVIVSPSCEVSAQALRDAGALDVVSDSIDLEPQLARAVTVALRFRRLRAQQRELSADLAHRERLSSLGLLAASVGHEINNPCAVILANATSMREDLESLRFRPRFQVLDELYTKASDWTEALSDTIGACRRIASIVATLGVFSRKADRDAPESVQLNEAINSVLRFVGKEVRLQAEIELELAQDLPFIHAAPHAIMQVLTNLVINSLQALTQSSEGTPTLRIRTTSDETTVMLEVSDNGPGIPPDLIGKVFEPFFTTKLGIGTGLGLFITRELVVRAGGDIFVESEVGKGTAFRIILPVQASAVVAKPPSLPPQARRLRVMIVDDDDMMLRSMARSLRDRFECIPVRSVEAARHSLERDDRIDVLVTDIVMGDRGGFDLYQDLLRERPALASRTVFFSGGVASESLRKALEETGRPILRKPVDVAHFVDVVRSVASGVGA